MKTLHDITKVLPSISRLLYDTIKILPDTMKHLAQHYQNLDVFNIVKSDMIISTSCLLLSNLTQCDQFIYVIIKVIKILPGITKLCYDIIKILGDIMKHLGLLYQNLDGYNEHIRNKSNNRELFSTLVIKRKNLQQRMTNKISNEVRMRGPF